VKAGFTGQSNNLYRYHHKNNFSLVQLTGLSIFFKSTSTSLFAGVTIDKNWNNFHEYLIQHSWKSGGTKDHFRRVKVPGTAPYWKAWTYTFTTSPSFNKTSVSLFNGELWHIQLFTDTQVGKAIPVRINI
jgi:hypothetical protein